jgi:DNA polymerase-3 subunit delta'
MIETSAVELEPLPWLQEEWGRLQQAFRSDRLGHALLLSGPKGIGKRRFADLIGAAVLCARTTVDGLPCGVCDECGLLRAGNHPDLTRLSPDEDSKSGEIKVDEVRALCASQAMTSSRGRRAVFRIAPAEALNTAAANSLLKTLEEPARSTLLLLVAESPGILPATVRSRCHSIVMTAPSPAAALPWLKARLPAGEDAQKLLMVANSAPLLALELSDSGQLESREQCFGMLKAIASGELDPIAAADAWQSKHPGLVLRWLAGWVSDGLRLACDPNAPYVSNPDQRGALLGLAARMPADAAHRLLLQIYAAGAEANSTVNKQLLFESLLLRWAALTRPRPPAHQRNAEV